MTEVLLSSSSHLASLLLPPFSSISACRNSGQGSNGEGDAGLVRDPDVRRVGGIAGFSMLLCVMILDDRRDAAARVLALRGGGDHED